MHKDINHKIKEGSDILVNVLRKKFKAGKKIKGPDIGSLTLHNFFVSFIIQYNPA